MTEKSLLPPPLPTARSAPASDELTAERMTASVPPSRQRGLYLLSWGVLALAAGAYLVAVVVRPNFIADWFPSVDRMLTQPQGNDQNRAQAIAEAARLRENLQQAQVELARLRQELGARDARVKASEMRIAGLEKELQEVRTRGPLEASAAPPPSPAVTRTLADSIGAPRETASVTPTGAPRSFEIVNGAPTIAPQAAGEPASAVPGSEVAMPLPERRPAVVPKPKKTPIAQITRPTIAITPNQIETGSVAAPGTIVTSKPQARAAEPITFDAPVVTRTPAQVGVRLTAGPSVDALRLSWSLMSERYGAELSGLQPRYVVGNTPAAPYALVAGPLNSSEDAQRVCGQLIAKGIPCSVDSFTGNAL